MNNQLLGKILKAMQKLSGKSINVLADESELTVDTINNLFYARIQKPGFMGVCRLVECMGFSVEDLMRFLKDEKLADMDIGSITEIIASYVNDADASVADTGKPGKKEMKNVVSAKAKTAGGDTVSREFMEEEIGRINTANEKYTEELKAHYNGALAELKNENEKRTRQFEKQIENVEKIFNDTLDRQIKLISSLRKLNNRYVITIIALLLGVIGVLLFDALNSLIGWIR